MYTPVATNIVVVSDGLRSTLTRSKFSKFSLGGMPPDPPTRLCICMLYIRSLVLRLLSDVLRATNAGEGEASARTGNCVLRAPHQSPLYMHAPPPPSSISGSTPALPLFYRRIRSPARPDRTVLAHTHVLLNTHEYT